MADAYKNTDVPLRSGELAKAIDIGKNNLASIVAEGVDKIRFLQDNAPVRIENFFGVRTGSDADSILAAAATPRRQAGNGVPVPANTAQVSTMFARGDVVVDTEHNKRVTIIKLNAAQTTKGKPVHKVATGSGNAWLQKESKLRRP